MADEIELDYEEQNELAGLLDVIRTQVDMLYYLADLDYDGLYDEYKEDKIKCVTTSFKTIAATQRNIMKLLQKAKQAKLVESD